MKYTQSTHKNTGFTIVELLVVIIVIAILATIVAVSYNGVQKSTLNASKLAALSNWRGLIQLHAAINGGRYPIPDPSPAGFSANEYCLGRDFMHDACWNVADVYGDTGVFGGGPRPNEPIAHESESLMSALEQHGTLPRTATCAVQWNCTTTAQDGVGPMVTYENGKPVSVWDFFHGGTCPGGISPVWTNGHTARCELRIE